MTDDAQTKTYIRRARWYGDRIGDLLKLMRDTPTMDADDVEQGQAMLRELLAAFRADQRPAPEGHVQRHADLEFSWFVKTAFEGVRIKPGSKPTARWRTELTTAKAHFDHYLERRPKPGGGPVRHADPAASKAAH
ncbi:MAG: hypothetical protein QM770_02890 [Tepidisphaeraceae bacterium]